jgi:hypothetical protein
MKRSSFGIVAIVVGVLLVACNPLDPNQSILLDVSNAAAPATIPPNTQLTITLTILTSGCRSFDRIVVQRLTTGVILAAFGQSIKGGNCGTGFQNELHSVTLDPPFSNPFTIQVDGGSLPPITTTVQVQ